MKRWMAAAVPLLMAQTAPPATRPVDLATIVAAAKRPIPAIDVELESAIATMMKPGPAEPGWPDIGIGIVAELAGRPGGIEGNALTGDREMPTVLYFGRASVPMPPGLTEMVVSSDGPGRMGVSTETRVTRLAPNLWLRIRETVRSHGRARCSESMPVFSLLTDTAKPLDDDDLIVGVSVVKMSRRVHDLIVCSVLFRAKDGVIERSFLPDGRSLPAMDEESSVFTPIALDQASRALAARPTLFDAPEKN